MRAIGPRLLAFFTERDLLLRPLGNTVYIMPPYCIDDGDLAALHEGIAGFLQSASDRRIA